MDGRQWRVKQSNLPKLCIQKFFPMRHCFVLCKPVNRDIGLGGLHSVSDNVINDEFLDAAESATQKIMSDAQPFKVKEKKISGSRMSYCVFYFL